MHEVFLGYIIAAVVAAIVSCIDLALARDKGMYLSVAPLYLLFILFDVATSLIICTPVEAGAKLFQSDPVEAAGVVTGLIATLLMRTSVTIPFLKKRPEVNSVAILRKLQVKVGTEINERCAAAETDWILDRVLPSLASLTVAEVEQWSVQALIVKFSDPAKRATRDKWVAEIHAAGEGDSGEECKRLIVQILQDTGSRRLVIGLMNRGKRKAAGANGAGRRLARPPRLVLRAGSPPDEADEASTDGQEQAAIGSGTPDLAEGVDAGAGGGRQDEAGASTPDDPNPPQ